MFASDVCDVLLKNVNIVRIYFDDIEFWEKLRENFAENL